MLIMALFWNQWKLEIKKLSAVEYIFVFIYCMALTLIGQRWEGGDDMQQMDHGSKLIVARSVGYVWALTLCHSGFTLGSSINDCLNDTKPSYYVALYIVNWKGTQ